MKKVGVRVSVTAFSTLICGLLVPILWLVGSFFVFALSGEKSPWTPALSWNDFVTHMMLGMMVMSSLEWFLVGVGILVGLFLSFRSAHVPSLKRLSLEATVVGASFGVIFAGATWPPYTMLGAVVGAGCGGVVTLILKRFLRKLQSPS